MSGHSPYVFSPPCCYLCSLIMNNKTWCASLNKCCLLLEKMLLLLFVLLVGIKIVVFFTHLLIVVLTIYPPILEHVKDKTRHKSAIFQNGWPPFCQIWIIFTHSKLSEWKFRLNNLAVKDLKREQIINLYNYVILFTWKPKILLCLNCDYSKQTDMFLCTCCTCDCVIKKLNPGISSKWF